MNENQIDMLAVICGVAFFAAAIWCAAYKAGTGKVVPVAQRPASCLCDFDIMGPRQ